MDKEREHIIADKTMLRVARVTSIAFTPFSSQGGFGDIHTVLHSLRGIPDSIRVFVPADHAAAIQVNRTGSGVLLYNPYAYPDHLPFP